jgi:hypothetical protein
MVASAVVMEWNGADDYRAHGAIFISGLVLYGLAGRALDRAQRRRIPN